MRDELVWIDCEMTGLDLRADRLIEIAALVTDSELNILGDGVDVVIHTDEAALDGMIDVVAQMHSRSGLIEEVRASSIDLATAETLVLDYIHSHVKAPKTAPLAGNSIATDRGFIARDMPTLDDFLHYRMIDVSSIKGNCAGVGTRGSISGNRTRAWHTGLWPISRNRSANPVLPAHCLRSAARAVQQRDRRDCERTGGRTYCSRGADSADGVEYGWYRRAAVRGAWWL